jgi:hypothetical protein
MACLAGALAQRSLEAAAEAVDFGGQSCYYYSLFISLAFVLTRQASCKSKGSARICKPPKDLQVPIVAGLELNGSESGHRRARFSQDQPSAFPVPSRQAPPPRR